MFAWESAAGVPDTLVLFTLRRLTYHLQGSKWTYSIAIILFGICNIITLWCAGFTVWLAVPHTLAGWKDFPQ
jgi:chitin synthase